ncbi:MAG TPA: prepilin-type cleavage/methylation domain-containing protein [Gemmatimonas aurantiaca]|uniref:Prepilin-type N-terminal cleavage/methylation domain-containing protein n=2 Tax=Gemmatimonas aurantiaca TaxID=173480 RepID=C1A6B4_GEMAT|nr:type II secretion system protein [Gemmatimonas aurantiaca]BAH37774.1 hypothetical protein GAU_0732 [Gemmatimonas aurantiaca T-27]HCT58807.1 prepilin-type cleavage/methylation domain-containing protein [Gemmatimonas aurantiaca]
MPAHSSRHRAGFTLLELIAVVTIVGAVMAIAAPRFRIARSTELQLAGMQMAQDIDVARTRSLSTRLLVRVSFNTTTKQYGGYLDHDGDGTLTQSAAEWQALRGFGERPLPKGISFGRGAAPGIPDDASSQAVTFTNSRVEFDSRGLVRPMGSSGVVYMTADLEPKAVVAISVAPSGNARFWTWSPEGGWK